MLRNVADPELLDRIRQKIDELFAKYADVTAERIEQYLASDDPSERDFWLTFRIGQVYERTFREFAGVSFFEIIRNNGLYDLAARVPGVANRRIANLQLSPHDRGRDGEAV